MFFVKKSFTFNDDIFVISVSYKRNPIKVKKVSLHRFEGNKFNKLADGNSIEECIDCMINVSNFSLFKKEFESIEKYLCI